MSHRQRLARVAAMSATLASSLAACGGDPTVTEVTSQQEERVTNGTTVTNDPIGMAALSSPLGNCSGTLLRNDWVLTARHCVGGTPQTSVSAQIGSSVSQSQFHVERSDLDVALVKLGSPLPFKGLTTGVSNSLWYGTLASLQGQTLYCSGYGNPGFGTLRSANLTVTSTFPTGYNLSINASKQILAPGDSGGSCVLSLAGANYITGVESGVTSTSASQISSDQFRDWVNAVMLPEFASDMPAVHALPGAANDMAIGTDVNTSWIIGTSSVPGGYAIYHRQPGSAAAGVGAPTGWVPFSTGAESIAAMGDGLPTAIDSSNIIRHWDGAQWDALPGTGREIAFGGGYTWLVGTSAVGGGYALYTLDNGSWTPRKGGALRIAVDTGANAWIVNNQNQIEKWNPVSWTARTGSIGSVSVGPDGSVWALGTTKVGGGNNILKWSGTGWTPEPGGAVAIDVGPNGPWIVNQQGTIFYWSGSGFTQVPTGTARDIGVGANGAVWIVGTSTVPGGYAIYKWSGSAWTPEPGGAVNIDVGPDGTPWIVNSSQQVEKWTGSGWSSPYPGLASGISVGADGTTWIVGTSPTGGGNYVWYWNGVWVPVPGGLLNIEGGPNGVPWGVNNVNTVFQGTAEGWTVLPGTGRDIATGTDGSVWLVGTSTLPNGYSVYHWTGSDWGNPYPSNGAVSIAVGPDGTPWITDNENHVLHAANGGAFTALPGTAQAVTVSVDGYPWIVGTSAATGGMQMYRWSQDQWQQVSGGAVKIDVGNDDRPWIINNANAIFQWNGSGWDPRPGTGNAIGVGANNAVWLVGTSSVGGGYQIYQWSGSLWAPEPGGGVAVDVAPNGAAWIINNANQIFSWTGSSFALMPGTGKDISIGADGTVWLVGTSGATNGNALYRWNGTTWVSVPGGGVDVSGGPNGVLGFVDSKNAMWLY